MDRAIERGQVHVRTMKADADPHDGRGLYRVGQRTGRRAVVKLIGPGRWS